MNEIMKSNTSVIQSMDDVERAARAMSASGFFPDSKEASKAIVKVLAGRELGFGAFASMTGVAVIQGKPVIGANLLAAAVKQTGKYNYRVTLHTENECVIDFFENKEKVGTSTFTMKDAAAAGLNLKDNWKKYPRNMLFARAIANGQKWYCPDVFNGVTVYTPDEMGATVDDEGNIIEGQAEMVQTPVGSISKAAWDTHAKRISDDNDQSKPAQKTNGHDKRAWTVAQKSALIEAGLAENDFSAKGMLGLSHLPENATAEQVIAWATVYRENRGFEKPYKMDATAAADIANQTLKVEA